MEVLGQEQGKMKKTNWPGHSFYWQTDLTVQRMREISDWVLSLPSDQKELLQDLVSDMKQRTQIETCSEFDTKEDE